MTRTNKYHAKRTVVDGITFHSKGEAMRYQELKLMEKAGEIENLIHQPVYEIIVNDELICKYIGDFQYFDKKKKETITEDWKGHRTALYRLKAKLMKAWHGITIFETGRRGRK